MTISLWRAPSLEDAFAAVEAVGRRHGPAVGPRVGLGSEAEFAELSARCGGELPEDLMAYLRWYDRELWRRFVNSTDSPLTPGGKGEVESDLYGIDSLDEVGMLNVGEDYNFRTLVGDLRHCGDSELAEGWLLARLLTFGSSMYGESLIYVLSAPGYPRGTVLTTTMDDPIVLWLGDSLAEWLARLAACNGTEYAFVPGSIDDLEPEIRARYVSEFHGRNPKSSFFRQ